MPGQNVMIADAGGRIGWVLSGRLPRRTGIDATRPSPWHAEEAGWDGWLPREETPRLLDPPAGFAWSANARVVGGESFARIGDGDYAAAARARQIRDRLAALASATPADMLAIQLDDRADYAARWQPVLHARARARRRDGSGAAGRRLERARVRGRRRLPFAARLRAQGFCARFPRCSPRQRSRAGRTTTGAHPERFTEVAWRLLDSRPPNLLDPRFEDWDAWLADVAARSVRDLPAGCANLADCRWGEFNAVRIRHPISEAVPALGRWLDMPTEPLPGDWSVPRVQSPGFGASERFAVSPGREAQGYFHMPGGQSGHPLSPFYRAGHAAWARGEATPFLPGEAAHVLALEPALIR